MTGKFKAFTKITSYWQHARWNVNYSIWKFPFPATISADNHYFDTLCHTAALEKNMPTLFHSIWNRKYRERQLDTIIQWRCCYLQITLSSKWPSLIYQPRRRYISTASYRIVFRHLALLFASIRIICTWWGSNDRIPNYKKILHQMSARFDPSEWNIGWFKYDRDWFVCKQAALCSSCATLREWSHNLHPPSCWG